MTPNNQKPEAAIKNHDGHELDLHSMFSTIQGEGPFTGHRAMFIRLAGCNLQCPGCDTEYTSRRVSKTPLDLVEAVKLAPPTELIVITGGEPFRQHLVPLIIQLLTLSPMLTVQIETNGVLPIPESFSDYFYGHNRVKVIVSPKTSRVHQSVDRIAAAYKYVLRSGSIADDGLPTQALYHKATPYVARPTKDVPIYVNPMDEQDDERNKLNLDACVRSCMHHGHILGIQLHKHIGME